MTHHAPGTPIILVGLKADLRCDSETLKQLQGQLVTPEEVETLRKDIGAVCAVECSAWTQDGLKCVFDGAVRAALTNRDKEKKSKGEVKEQKTGKERKHVFF